jgi:hypothetical protein
MNWKICCIVFINALFIIFPYNILGCGPDADPYDCYTSFFHKDLTDVKGYQPFYYVNDLFLYSEAEPEDAAHATASDWISYCNNNATVNEAYDFVARFAYNDLSKLYAQLEKKPAAALPDSVNKNAITKYFQQSNDLEALGYLMYAKKVEPWVIGTWNDWDAVKRDSLKMSKLIKDGQQLYAVAKKDFVKLRYAYQIQRLALYSGNSKDCIRYYDELVKNNPVKNTVQDLALSLKAGAMFRQGSGREAAYLFSQQFTTSNLKRVANYMSFSWCVKRLDAADRKACIALCKNATERANMLGLFALGSNAQETVTINSIYQSAPKTPLLEVLAIREVNKIEERYFSPELTKQKGGKQIYLGSYYAGDDNAAAPWQQEVKELIALYHTIAQNKAVPNRPLFEVAAAYLAYISKNYTVAKEYLANTDKMAPTEKVKDQVALVRLLVTINEKQAVDSSFEATLLPSVQWLAGKVKSEGKGTQNYYYNEWSAGPWKQFYRNLFSEILAKAYHKQGAVEKEALCIGNGESILGSSWIGNTEDFVHNEMATKDLLALNKLLHAAKKSAWEQYCCTHFPMKADAVTDVIAMSHTRDYNFATALEWLNKIKDPGLMKLERNPFGDMLKDNQDDLFAFDKGAFNKTGFVKEMAALMNKEKQHTATAADLYKLGVGYYNMTYYGRAWQTVKYYRSGSDGYGIPPNATSFQKEYYGCFTAEKYFQKAMQAAADNNVKARCLFMMAKCAQKRIAQPAYDYNNQAAYDKASTDYMYKFTHSQYFPALQKDYGNTPFFKEAVNTCSYLKDFVEKK